MANDEQGTTSLKGELGERQGLIDEQVKGLTEHKLYNINHLRTNDMKVFVILIQLVLKRIGVKDDEQGTTGRRIKRRTRIDR